MTIFIEDSFDSAHFLPNVPDGHKCGKMHGHTYRIRIEVSGRVGKRSGWVIDYTQVKQAWDSVKRELDHGVLNEIHGLENPTCEHIAEYVWDALGDTVTGLIRIELRDSPADPFKAD